MLNFSLEEGEDGRPVQRTESCGTFLEVERAFAVARERARAELVELQSQAEADGAPYELIDTEWGYDLRQEHLIVSRFWVHDRAPSALQV